MAQRGMRTFQFQRGRNRIETGLQRASSSAVPQPTADDAETGDSYSMENMFSVWCQQKKRQVSETQTRLDAAMAQISCLREQLSSVSTEKQQLLITNQKLVKSHHQIEEGVRYTDRRCRDIKAELVEATKTLDDVNSERITWISRIEEKLQNKFESRAEQTQTSLQHKIDSLQQQLDEALEKARTSQDLYCVANEARLRNDEQLEEVKSKLACITEEKNTAQLERDNFECEWNRLQYSFNQELEKKVHATLQELDDERISRISLRKELEEARRRLVAMESELSTTSNDLCKLRVQTQSEKTGQKALIDEMEDLRQRARELVLAKDKMVSEKETLSAALAVCQNHLATSQDKYNKTFAECSSVKSEFESANKEKNTLLDKVINMENRLKATTNNLAEANCIRTELCEKLKNTEIKLSSEEEIRAEAQRQLSETSTLLTISNQNLEQKTKEVEEMTADLTSSKELSRQLEVRLESNELNLENVKEELEKQLQLCSQLEKETNELRAQLMNKDIQLDYREIRLQELEKKLSENAGKTDSDFKSNEELMDLKRQLAKKSHELECTQDKLKEMEVNISNSEKEFASLKSKVALMEHNVEFFKKKSEVLQKCSSLPSSTMNAPSRATGIAICEPTSTATDAFGVAETKSVSFKDKNQEFRDAIRIGEARAVEEERIRLQKTPANKQNNMPPHIRGIIRSETKKRPVDVNESPDGFIVEASPILRSLSSRSYKRQRSSSAKPTISDSIFKPLN